MGEQEEKDEQQHGSGASVDIVHQDMVILQEKANTETDVVLGKDIQDGPVMDIDVPYKAVHSVQDKGKNVKAVLDRNSLDRVDVSNEAVIEANHSDEQRVRSETKGKGDDTEDSGGKSSNHGGGSDSAAGNMTGTGGNTEERAATETVETALGVRKESRFLVKSLEEEEFHTIGMPEDDCVDQEDSLGKVDHNKEDRAGENNVESQRKEEGQRSSLETKDQDKEDRVIDNVASFGEEEEQRSSHETVGKDKENRRKDIKEANGHVSPPGGQSKLKLPLEDFDDMLQHVGSWGRFQIMLTIFFFPFNLFLGYVYLSSILTNFTPPHWCKVEELQSLSQEERRSLAIPFTTDEHGIIEYSKCRMYNTNWSQVVERGVLSPDPSWPMVDCMNGWEFDTENYHRSVVSDFSWVCGDSWVPALSQAIFFVGAIPGTLFFGWVSDNYGRIPVTVVTNVIAMVAGLATPFVSNYQGFLACRFLMGLSFSTFFHQPYILTLEYVDESKRTFVGNIGLAIFLTISGVYQPWLIKALGDWRTFNWILFGQFITIAALPFIMPESGRWLLAKGKIDRAEKILRRIALINKKQVSEEVYESFRSLARKQQEQNRGSQTSFLDLFRSPNLRRITIMIIILWMLTSLLFDASVRNVENLNFSIYISFMISTGLELPADLLSILGLEYLGRRWSASLSLGLTGIFMLATIPFLGSQSVWGVGVLSMMSRFCATYAMNTGFQFTVEVMPTEVRSQGTALANVMSMVSQIGSPYIVKSNQLHPAAPFIIIGICGLIASIPGLFLPETAGINLPDSIQDAEDFGRHDKFFWIPLAKNTERYKKSKMEKKVGKVSGVDNPASAATPDV